MRLSVLFFARSREVVGKDQVQLDVSSTLFTTTQLAARLQAEYPGLKELWQAIVFAVNQVTACGSVATRIANQRSAVPELAAMPR